MQKPTSVTSIEFRFAMVAVLVVASGCAATGGGDVGGNGTAVFDLEADDGMSCSEVHSATHTDGLTRCPVQVGVEGDTVTIGTPMGTMVSRYQEVDGFAIVEGDIIVGEVETLHAMGAQAAGRAGTAGLWPKGVVPYAIQPGFPNAQRITDAIKNWESNTGLRFVPHTTEHDFVTFVVGSGCSSYVGRIGGEQKINLAAGCPTGATIHEIGHSIGFWHEQARPDRDAVITVHYENIQSGYASQFDVVSAGSYLQLGSYDIHSIMHYGPYGFSKNGRPTITLRDGSLYTENRSGLSTLDIAGAAKLYESQLGTPKPPPPPPPATDKTPPTAVVTAPAEGSSFKAYSTIEVVATAKDDGAMGSVELLWKTLSVKFPCPGAGGAWSCTTSGNEYRWKIRVGTGDRVFQVHAKDAAGNEGFSADRTLHFH